MTDEEKALHTIIGLTEGLTWLGTFGDTPAHLLEMSVYASRGAKSLCGYPEAFFWFRAADSRPKCLVCMKIWLATYGG